MEDSIFTKIIKGEIPSHKIYEDENTYVFLDIHPSVEGHTLVVPKKQVPYLWQMEDEDYIALKLVAKKVAHRLQEVLGTEYIGEKVVGIGVPHTHIHLIPFNTEEEFNQPESTDEPNHGALAALADRIKF